MKNIRVLTVLVVATFFCIINIAICEDEISKPFTNSTDPACGDTRGKCKEMPKLGQCVAVDPSNNDMSAKAGSKRPCCPVWECTHGNGTITQHWGMQGSTHKKVKQVKIVKASKSVSQSYSSSSSSSFFMNMQSSSMSHEHAHCSSVHCSMKPTEGTCSSMNWSNSSLASKVESHRSCCTMWRCQYSHGHFYIAFALSMSEHSDMTSKGSSSSSSSSSSFSMSSSSSSGSNTNGDIAMTSCSQVQCGAKPAASEGLGNCESKNVTSSEIGEFKSYGSLSHCCPLWECTTSSQEITEYYAIFRISSSSSSSSSSKTEISGAAK